MEFSSQTKKTVFYIIVAFFFSIAMRLVWVYHFSGYESFFHNGQFMINTNDGYYWAEGARDIVRGVVENPDAKEYLQKLHQPHDLSPTTSAAAVLTAFFVKLLPFSFETVIFYLPAFLSSLVVIPIILIAKKFDNLEMGLIAALLGSIAWSYYNRTMVGYYDTDMLNIVLPMLLLWSIIWAIDTNQDRYLLFTALDILAYRWWYPQSYSLEFAFFGLILAYTLVFDRKNTYNYKLMAIMLFAMMNLDAFVRLGVVVGVFVWFKKQELSLKALYGLLGVAFTAFLVSGGFDPIWGQLKNYVFRDTLSKADQGLGLHFFTVMQTVREAGKIPFETFANRISGHVVVFLISLVGYAFLLYKHRVMLFSLPLLGLGFLAYVGGLRFTIYAVPVLALGLAFLIVEIAKRLPTRKLQILFATAATLAALYPNYRHIDAYRVPTVFSAGEVRSLVELGGMANREDYVVAWWDYGYPIRYYADVKTLIDGGKHSGADNFPVSFILTHPQDVAAKMARLDVEFTEKTYDFIDKHKKAIEDKNITVFSTIEQMTKAYGFDDTNDFLDALQTDIKLPKKTRDVYLYLPYRMLQIYPTVALFSNIDLMTGKRKKRPFFYVTSRFQETPTQINLGNGIVLDKQDGMLSIGKNRMPLRRFVSAKYDSSMHYRVKEQMGSLKSPLTLIYLASYHTFVLLDEASYNSLYVQAALLDRYDKNYFEKVIDTPEVKILKLKI